MWSKLIVLLCLFCIQMNAEPIYHYYVKVDIDEVEKDSSKIEFGYIKHGTSFDLDFHPLALESQADFSNYVKRNLPSDFDINLYIHGMWANQSHIWHTSTKQLVRSVFAEREKAQVIISVIWDAAILYPNSVDKSIRTGKYLSPLLSHITSWSQHGESINVLAHSMGNRVFQHMIAPYLSQSHLHIHKYISLGADVENSIFEKDKDLEKFTEVVDKTIVYNHNNDRTLKLSKLINKENRLGLEGVSEDLLESGKFINIDVSSIRDNNGISATISNHRYYYTSPSVRSDIRASLTNAENNMRIPLSKNRYKLVEKE